MATAPKVGDNSAAAFSAIEDAVSKALEEHTAGAATESKSTADQGRGRSRLPGISDDELGAPSGTANETTKKISESTNKNSPTANERPSVAPASAAAANDDRPSVGQVLQSLQQKPARAPLMLAWLPQNPKTPDLENRY